MDVVVVGPFDASGARQVADNFRVGYESEKSSGLSAAVNQIWGAADHEYIGWLGDDDLLTPDSVRLTLTALLGRRSAVLAYGRCRVIDAQGATLYLMRPGRFAPWFMQYGADFLPQPGALIRASAVNAVGFLDERLQYAMDLDLFLRLRQQGPFVYIPNELAAFRLHETSLTVSNPAPGVEASQVRYRYLGRTALTFRRSWEPPVKLLGRAWAKWQTLDRGRAHPLV